MPRRLNLGGSLIAPRSALYINWGHKATKELQHLFVCAGAGMRDVVTGKFYPATGGSQGVGTLGVGWQSGGTGTRINGPSGAAVSRTGNYAITPVTSLVAGKFTTTNIVAIGIANTYAVASGGWVLAGEVYNNTNQVGFVSLGVGLDYSSGIATPARDGSVLSLVMVPGTTTYRVNESYGSSANVTPLNTGDTITVGAGFRNGAPIGPLPSGDIVYWAAIFSRALPLADLALWHTGPFGVLVTPLRLRTRYMAAAAATGIIYTRLERGIRGMNRGIYSGS